MGQLKPARAALRASPLAVALVALALESPAYGSTHGCHSWMECAPFESCSVDVGGCGNDDAPLAVCTGRCQLGLAWRVAGRVGATAVQTSSRQFGATFGIEILPPILGGHLSFAADGWTEGVVRVGVASPWTPGRGILLAPRIDGGRAFGQWMGVAALRVDWAPWWPFDSLYPAHFFSFYLEGGEIVAAAAFPQTRFPFLSLGIALWPLALR